MRQVRSQHSVSPPVKSRPIAALWQALRDVLQGRMDTGGAPFELNLQAQEGGWDAPLICSSGRKVDPSPQGDAADLDLHREHGELLARRHRPIYTT
jgi:hypothetical protein